MDLIDQASREPSAATPATRAARCGNGVEKTWRWHGKRHVRLQVWGDILSGGAATAKMAFPLCLSRPGSRAGKDKGHDSWYRHPGAGEHRGKGDGHVLSRNLARAARAGR